MSQGGKKDFIKVFHFQEDNSKEGRLLATAKIGDVYMSRLVIDPGVTTGGYYHKETRMMFYVGNNPVEALFEHVLTGEQKKMRLEPGKQAIHVPENVIVTTKNISTGEAVLVFFSNKPLRSNDNYERD